MLVAKPEWICSRLVTLAASQPPFETVTRSERLARSPPSTDVAAIDDAVVDELEAVDDRLRGRRGGPDLDRSPAPPELDDVARPAAIDLEIDERS